MPRKATGKPNGRPGYKPTEDDRKTVSLMCAVGIPHEGIALCIGDNGIDDKTLRKHFPRELATSKIKADAKMAGSLFQAGLAGNVNAQKWWTMSQMGWKEKSEIEHSGEQVHTIKWVGVE
jgi:hypothetical protein